MEKVKELNRDGYIGEGATVKALLNKVNELVEHCNDIDAVLDIFRDCHNEHAKIIEKIVKISTGMMKQEAKTND